MVNPSQIALFAFSWMLWCLVHSLLISGPFARFLTRLVGRGERLLYNGIAVLTLLPLVFWEYSVERVFVLSWPVVLQPVRLVLLFAGVWLMVAGAKAFSLLDFSGLSVLRAGEGDRVAREGTLTTTGILSHIRHPWYTAGFLLLWLRDLHLYSMVSNLILSVYLVLGAMIEERRLLNRFGAPYANYCRRVPRFIPKLRP